MLLIPIPLTFKEFGAKCGPKKASVRHLCYKLTSF